jgi:NAD(P)H-hydrate epimerase
MAATAAARVGAGLVTLAIPASEYPQTSARLLEVMQAPLEASALGEFAATQANFGALEALLEGKQAVVFGPGVGVSEDTRKLAEFLFLHARAPVVVDADGLNLIAQDPALLQGKRPPMLVLTPHPGEMGRLTGQSTKAVQNDRVGTANAYAGRHGVFVVLKGARTITVCPEGPVWVNTSGCPAMASGGMGDVLSGMLGGLLAQGLSPYEAIPFGVFAHGAAGERMAVLKGTYGLLAGDLLGALPSIFGDYVAQNPGR